MGIDAAPFQDLFPERTIVTVGELRQKVKDLKGELSTLGAGKLAIEGIINAFTTFQKPLQECIDRANRLQDFLKFSGSARDVATRREEARVALQAEALLDSVSRKRNLETAPAASAEDDAETEGLAADLIRSLSSGITRK